MKQGWEIKKLGEVCEIINGFAFKSQLFKDRGDDILRISNIQNGVVVDDDIAHFSKNDYPQVDLDKYTVFPNDIVVALSGATTGKFGINNTGRKLYLNQRVAICREKTNDMHHRFLLYFLKTQSKSFLESAAGVAQPNLSTEQIKLYEIPIPPLPVQERIVAELDLLSGIIEKQKQQLKELDNLAQSIFYDMFGDPITNEKGWDIFAIDNVCSSIVRGPFGSALKKDFFVEPSNNTYKVYEQKHAIQKSATIGTYYISCDMFKTLSRFEVKSGDIIMSCSGTIGEFYEIPNGAERGIMNQALLKFTLNSLIHKSYFLYTMEWVKENFEKKGSGLQNIGSVKTIKKTSISIPLLTLQQEFASKIEAIEKQKAILTQSIAETETLFNSRMDYYFN